MIKKVSPRKVRKGMGEAGQGREGNESTTSDQVQQRLAAT
jgi:hypothetical protein